MSVSLINDHAVDNAHVEWHEVGHGVERSRFFALQLRLELGLPVNSQPGPCAESFLSLREVALAELRLRRLYAHTARRKVGMT